jgi:DNA-binding transcriptional LysR family regulator
MLPYLEGVDTQTRAAKDAAKAVKGLKKIKLKIGVMCTIGPQLVSGLLPRFQGNNPDVEIDVIDDSASKMVERLGKGDLEIAFVGSHENLPDTLHQLPIFDERFVILLPPNHPLTAKPEIHAADLHQQPYVSRSQCEVFRYVSEDLKHRGIEPRIVFRSPRDDWVQGMIKAGLGFGFFPESSVTNTDVVVRPLIDPEYRRTVFLATVRGRPHSPAVGAFIREARYHDWPTSLP